MYRVPIPKNEPILNYAPGSPERVELEKALTKLKSQTLEIPMIINGEEITTDTKIEIHSPHKRSQLLGYYCQGREKEVAMAVDAAVEAQKTWSHMPWEQRSAIFLKAADLIAGPYRHVINAATMLAHSKTIFQAEIDAVCELVDFWRFNCYFAQQIYDIQPDSAPQLESN